MRHSSKYLAISALMLSACGGEEGDDSGVISSSTTSVSAGALSAAYVADWSVFEAEATRLRDTVSRYTFQNFNLLSGYPANYSRSYYLDHSNVEYAHAAGLTGAGQTISVVDGGFLTSHDEFNGKTLTLTTGAGSIGIDDHGTAVAAIAAGSATSGQSIGVAPGANLHLGLYDTDATTTAATQQARVAGAIVQNNSWGYTSVPATTANYNWLFGSGSGQGYLNALRSFSNNAIVVFAVSNSSNQSQIGIMAGLPIVAPSLENSWIAVGNAVPTYSGGSITSATRYSSRCLAAAAWCMVADGVALAADSSGNSSYTAGYGSSYAAPQVSGAIALLAQAFPTLTAQDLRARLLASANNSFYAHTGYVQFGTVKHGYNSNLGHGFLDLKAALSPIGGSFARTASGAKITLGQPLILSGGMAGNALTKRLASYSLDYNDGLGAGFSAPANILAAESTSQNSSAEVLGELLATDLTSRATDPFNLQSSFSSVAEGRQIDIDLNDTRISMLLPQDGTNAPSFGMGIAREFDLGGSNLEIGFSAMHEGDGVVGVRSLVDNDSMSSTHGAATFEWAVPIQPGQEFAISGSVGVAMPNSATAATSLSAITYNSVKLTYASQNLFGHGDKLTVGVGLPDAVQSGHASFGLAQARSGGGTTFRNVDIPLAPEGRQLDLSMGYGVPLSRNSELVMSAVHSLNSGNIAGVENTTASIGWKFSF